MSFWKKPEKQKAGGGYASGADDSRKKKANFYDDTPDPDAWPYLNILNDPEVVHSLIFKYLNSCPEKSASAKDITLFVVSHIFDSDENLRRLNAVGAASEILKNARMKMKDQGSLLYNPDTMLWSLSEVIHLFPPDQADLDFLKEKNLGTGWQKALKKEDIAAWLYQNLTPDGFEQFCVAFLKHRGCKDVRVSEKQAISDKIQGVDGGIDGYGFMSFGPTPEDRLDIAFQAKKFAPKHPVGVKEIREFIGALMGRQISYGFFLTTSFFSTPAKDYLKELKNPYIAAMGGVEMVNAMMPDKHGPGLGLVSKPYDRSILIHTPFLLHQAGE